MRVLLVYPKCPEMTFWSFDTSIQKFTDKKTAHVPLGLLTVASMLPVDWNLELVDENVRQLADKDIRSADLVLSSAMLVQKDSARRIINQCYDYGKTIIAGGPFFTTCHKEELTRINHVLRGEIEDTIDPFLEDFQRGVAKHIYPIPEKKPDLSKTPIPMWGLINPKDYVTPSVQHSRGCPFKCDFCDIIVMYGRIQRVKHPEQIISEVHALYNAGWKGPLFFSDDNFVGNKRQVKRMLHRLIHWQNYYDYPFHLITQASINLADDDELLSLMRAANFREVFIGIESVSEACLEECGKSQNLNRSLIDSVNKIQDQYGIQVMGSLIIGFENDPPDNAKRQINFVRKVHTPIVQVSRLCALPDTPLYNNLLEKNRIKGSGTGENTDGSTNIQYSDEVEEKLSKDFCTVITTIYSPPELYDRIWRLVKNLPPNTKGNALTKSGLKTLLKSFWKIGVLAKDRRLLFWKLIAKTLLFYPKNFPVLGKHLVFGEHLMFLADKFRD